jgi:exodeoxyribonuclease-5
VRRPNFVLNPESELHHAALIVIDECSMVDERMGQDLLSFEKKILVLGDPAQLPPVRGEGFFTGQKPDVMLTEIHRQAKDNPIIQLATLVREGKSLSEGSYGSSRVGPLSLFSKQLAQQTDQVIVGRNLTRAKFNQNYRQNILGLRSPLPCVGDKLVCLRNNHDLGLLNGQLWTVEETTVPDADQIDLVVRSDDGQTVQAVNAHTQIFLGSEIPWWARKDAEEFDYGYALTCHKSQGSQWAKTLIFDESLCFRENARQWLYTAITRASESVTILR